MIPLVHALELPAGFTVKPEKETRQIVVSRDGTIVARAEPIAPSFQRSRAFRWGPSGVRITFAPLDVLAQTAQGSAPQQIAVDDVAVAGSFYITASVFWSGAYSGTTTQVQAWGGDGAKHWPVPKCLHSGDAQDQKAYGGDNDGRIALTMDMTGSGSFLVMSDNSEQYAPYAFIVRNGSCRNLGRGIVQAVRGQWASGYRGYLNGHLAPDNLNVIVQKAIAVRWYGERIQELGDGDALAVNSSGLAVGADAVPGRFDYVTTNYFSKDGSGHEYRSPVPHAVAWDTHGRRIAIAPNASRSAAYDVGDDGTVVGMLVANDGKHYAFRYRGGDLERLDDLPHPAGWRFESAYAIGTDGTIAGIGTLNGVATVFTWRS